MSEARRWIDALLAAWGPQHWWPAESPFEVCVGAILTQNTNWKNVEKAIANLKSAGAMSCEALLALPPARLEELIKPAGTFHVKGKRLLRFCTWLRDEMGGDLDRVWAGGASAARERLLEVNGIGQETADSMALYAGGLTTFVADSYTHRILARHGRLDWESGYDDVRGWWMDGLPTEAPLFNEAHALLVRVGKEHCGRVPKCEGCPLKSFLPPSGPAERGQ